MRNRTNILVRRTAGWNPPDQNIEIDHDSFDEFMQAVRSHTLNIKGNRVVSVTFYDPELIELTAATYKRLKATHRVTVIIENGRNSMGALLETMHKRISRLEHASQKL